MSVYTEILQELIKHSKTLDNDRATHEKFIALQK